MSNTLSVLMTVYNESQFIEYAIKSCLPHVDHLVIVEGAYQESIALGAVPRSTDGTIEKIFDLLYYKDGCSSSTNDNHKIVTEFSTDKVHYIQANEKSDKDQRNVGLAKIKELNPDGWCLIIDGDEVYDSDAFKMIRIAMNNMSKTNKYAAYFKSMTFIGDFHTFTEQEFPRLFKITPNATFVNDNFMSWDDKKIGWYSPHIIKIPYISYHHYSFCKGAERFKLKEKWWQTRFGKPFDYGWKIDESGKITDEDHEICQYTGRHPPIMCSHPLYHTRWSPPKSDEGEE